MRTAFDPDARGQKHLSVVSSTRVDHLDDRRSNKQDPERRGVGRTLLTVKQFGQSVEFDLDEVRWLMEEFNRRLVHIDRHPELYRHDAR